MQEKRTARYTHIGPRLFIDGTLVMRGASKEDVARLDKGIYIVGGKKVMVR